MSNCAKEAYDLVLGDRNKSYGPPSEDYLRTSKVWSGLLIHKLKPGCEISIEEAMLMMSSLKLCREMTKHKHDNLVDAIGYLACAEWHIEGKPERLTIDKSETDVKNFD